MFSLLSATSFGEKAENIGGFVTEQQRWRVRFEVKGVVNP